jgi:iron complex outermembrane receptor protein
MRTRAAAWRLCATALAGGCLVSTQAWAEDQPTQPTSQPSPNRARQDARTPGDNPNDEIVVTAEKRPEGVQNVPIAITALSGQTLDKAGIKTVGDLTQLTPSLQFGTKSTNIFIAIRGIGQAGQDIGSQSGVTVQLDGVPLLNHFLMNPAFLDVQRVEVLRGPQGTFQGRNATGGAINVYSNPPVDRTEGGAEFTVGNYGRIASKGFINVPLGRTLDGRLSYQVDQADGWLKNGWLHRTNNTADLAELRGQLLFKPASNFSIRALLDWTRDDGDPDFAEIFGRADPNIPTSQELPGYPYPVNDLKHLTVYTNDPNQRRVKDLRGTVIAKWDLGPGTTLTSTSGYIKHNIKLLNIDVDATPAPTSTFPLIGLYAKEFTQELTLTTDLGRRADLVAGLFYMHGDSSEPLYLNFLTFTNFLVYLPEEKLDSYAAYAQLRYHLTDKIRLTVGGRFTRDSKSYSLDAATLGVHTLLAGKDHWDAFTPRFAVDYTPNDNSLIYASVSRGFKSGGFNTLPDTSLPPNKFNPEYVWNYEAGLKQALFGRRLRFGVTGFYSHYTNLQQTVFIINPVTQVRFPRVLNSAGSNIKGIELEANATAVPRLVLGGSLTRLWAKYAFFCNADPLYPNLPTDPACVGQTVNGSPVAVGSQNLQGNQLTQAPKWQYSLSGQYTFLVSNRLGITPRLDYKWQSRVYFDIYNHPLNSQAAYGLLNASLAVGPPSGAWSLTGWVRNAFDKRYVTQASVAPGVNPSLNGSIGAPRIYGVTAGVRF